MLKSLFIKQYALIDEINIELGPGLSIITGETGAGKSILIGALSMLLGERASIDVIRKGSEKAIVEGTFLIQQREDLSSLLREYDLDIFEELLIRREISVKGQNRCFINDSPVSLSLLKQIGDLLVDLHGQHDHQSLLNPSTHIGFLDAFGGLEPLVAEYRNFFSELNQLIAQQKALLQRERSLKEKMQLFQFQIQEIDAVSPTLGEEETIEADIRILENAEKLFSLTAEANGLLYESDSSVSAVLNQVRKKMEQLIAIDQSFGDSFGEIRSAEIIVEETAKSLQRYNEQVEFNSERLEQLRERSAKISMLRKKYGTTLEGLIEHRKKIGDELQLAENFEAEREKTEKSVEAARKAAGIKAAELTARRNESAKTIEKAIVTALAELGIQNGRFAVRIAQEEIDPLQNGNGFYYLKARKAAALSSSGADIVEFLLSTNAGEEVKPLVKVASGGEVSRIMLALKSAMAASDKIPVMIFDEIDVGVSGRIGQAVGKCLRKLSQSHQIIAITHLPQIAALADTHFAVEKTESGSRTTTRLRKLEKEEKIREVAKLMSGDKVTEAGLKGARELMDAAN